MSRGVAGRWRQRIYRQIEPTAAGRLSLFNKIIAILILLSVAFAIADSEPTLTAGIEHLFWLAEIAFAVIFLVEYVGRVWVSGEDPRYAGGVRGKLRYMTSIPAVLDLLAILPALLPMIGPQAYLLRLARMIRIFRLSKLGRYSAAISAIADAVRSRRYELLMSLWAAALVLIVSSSLLYVVEGPIQPDAFGSIPRAMWWAIATLTTVGYGDILPVTPLGRVLAAITAIAGIGLIAMPTGILASAFSDAMARRRSTGPDSDSEPMAEGGREPRA